MAKSGTTVSYAYNQDGLRVQKNVNGTVTNYVLHGSNIVHMTQGSNTLHFFYDAQNSPAVVEYNGVSYGYVKNLQGDIIAIVNASGTKVVEYVYDAWGKLLSKTGSMASTLGTLNPFRYRGYVYDEETGLYYLRSRYYNPVWSRFVNADNHFVRNLYSYAENSPICYEDKSGTEAIAITYQAGYNFAAVSSVLAGLRGVFFKISPILLFAELIFTPASTANDEAVWEAIYNLPAYGTLTSTLESAKEKANSTSRKPNKQTNIHHIVPQTMTISQPARDMLINVGIDPVTSPENQVEVSTQMHWFMHTKAYSVSVNTIIGFAYNISDKQDVKRTNVSLALSLLASLIRTIDHGE